MTLATPLHHHFSIAQPALHQTINLLARPYHPRERRPQSRPHRKPNDDIATTCNPRAPHAGNGAAHDQSIASGRDAADETAQFENEHGKEERRFQVEVLERLPPGCGIETVRRNSWHRTRDGATYWTGRRQE